MIRPTALVVRAPGTNRDGDVAFALEQAGAQPARLLLHEVFANPKVMHSAQLLVLPGGFSYADALGAGRLFHPTVARAMRHIGIGVLAGALFNVFAVTNLSRWIAGGHGGYLYLDLSGIVLGVVGAALVLLARLVDQARALQAELDEIP